MRSPLGKSLLALLVAGACSPALADDLTGVDRFLCAAIQVTVCAEDECETGAPDNWNIPQFIQVDMKKKVLATTPASGEARSTPLESVQRTAGLIVLQGFEGGRAFSFVIDEKTGKATVAVARDGATVGVFGACTPSH